MRRRRQPKRSAARGATRDTTPALVAALVLVGMAIQLFVGLGERALWDDEANTALYAKSVWQNGEPHAVLDHHVIAWGHGATLTNLRNRYQAPLAFYLAAPFTGPGGSSAFLARLPFAVAGWLVVAGCLFWLWRTGADPRRWWLFGAGLLGQTALVLYGRQCRYYTVAMLLTLAIAWFYTQRRGRVTEAVVVSALLLLLLTTNHLLYAATVACLGVDYLVWGRRKRALALRDWAILAGSQIAVGAAFLSVYNPLSKNPWNYELQHWLADRATLYLWNLRDLNRSEMLVGALLFLAPVLYLRTRRDLFLRGPVAVAVWCLVVALFSPQPTEYLSVAAVRYLAPLIPLGLLISVTVIETLAGRRAWVAAALAALAFGTNVLHGGPWAAAPDRSLQLSAGLPPGSFRSTPLELLSELRHPPAGAATDVADWLRANVPTDQSIWVQPDYSAFPLMFHAPDHQYAWMLDGDAPEYEGLDPVHFAGRVPPDWVVVFGPVIAQISGTIREWEAHGLRYVPVQQLDRYWYDLNRPAIFWHAFRTIEDFNRNTEAIYIYRRVADG